MLCPGGFSGATWKKGVVELSRKKHHRRVGKEMKRCQVRVSETLNWHSARSVSDLFISAHWGKIHKPLARNMAARGASANFDDPRTVIPATDPSSLLPKFAVDVGNLGNLFPAPRNLGPPPQNPLRSGFPSPAPHQSTNCRDMTPSKAKIEAPV